MFIYERTIRVQDTDATGAIYFANQLQIALEAFEEFLLHQGFSVGDMISKNQFLLPIVHTEGDFFAPLAAGDRVEVTLSFSRVGTTSFTHTSDLLKKNEKVGTVSIVHVVYCPEKKQSIPIPEEIKKIISPLSGEL
ncbi:MAG: acyl-CoA thioesterase [Chlamydiia bacterium]|nr:acyl-CoA thioesterase [Chlamydiia bacterium]